VHKVGKLGSERVQGISGTIRVDGGDSNLKKKEVVLVSGGIPVDFRRQLRRPSLKKKEPLRKWCAQPLTTAPWVNQLGSHPLWGENTHWGKEPGEPKFKRAHERSAGVAMHFVVNLMKKSVLRSCGKSGGGKNAAKNV